MRSDLSLGCNLHGHEVRLNLYASSCGPTEPELKIGFHAAQAPIYAVSMHSAVDCTTEISHEKPSMRGGLSWRRQPPNSVGFCMHLPVDFPLGLSD